MKKVKPIFGIVIALAVGAGVYGAGSAYVSKAQKEFLAQEAAMPESAITTYFGHLKNKEYEEIYQDSLKVDSHLNSKEDYIAKLESIYDGVNTDEIEYTGLDNTDGSKSYQLYYDQKYLANLKLIKNADGTWLSSTIFAGDLSYRIEVPQGLSITANGLPVSAEYCKETGVTAENFQGLSNTSSAPLMDVYVLENLLGEPVIEVAGESGYGTLTDVVSGTIYVGKESSSSDLAETFINYATICAGYPARETSLAQVGAISVRGSDWYSRVSGVQNQWFTSHTTSGFSNEKAFNIIQQSEDTAVGYVIFDYYAANSEVSRTWHGGYQMTLVNQGGTWKIAGMGIDNELNPAKVIPSTD